MKKLILLLSPFLLIACNSGGSSSTSFQITSISPTNNTTIVTNQSFNVTFNNNVNSGTLSGNVTMYNKATQQNVNNITCTTPNASSAICTPAGLAKNTGYTLTLGSGIQSSSGISLTSASYTYTTGNN